MPVTHIKRNGRERERVGNDVNIVYSCMKLSINKYIKVAKENVSFYYEHDAVR